MPAAVSLNSPDTSTTDVALQRRTDHTTIGCRDGLLECSKITRSPCTTINYPPALGVRICRCE
jgi:hypothetical protein